MERLLTIPFLTFDQYINLCTDQSFIDSMASLLHVSKSNIRIFMTCYVFKYFPSEIMDPNIRTREDLDIISQAEHLIDSIITPLYTEDFQLNLLRYNESFIAWKEFDRPRTALPFINKYKNLRVLRNTNDNVYYKNELKQLIDMTFLQLITMIQSIGGETSLECLDSDTLPIPDEELNTEFISSSQELFWTTFREDLNYIKIAPLLIDFIHRYHLVIPNRGDVLEQLCEILDVEFIIQQLNTRVDANSNRTISINELVSYMDFIVLKIKEIDIPSNDVIIDQWYLNLKTSIRSISDPIYFLQTFFDYIFNRLDVIKDLSIELTPTIRDMYNERNNRIISE